MALLTAYIENEKEFMAAIRAAKDEVRDLTLPLTLIARDFYKSEKTIFMLGGPGQYEDLRPRTKTTKQRLYGRVYPILKATGALERSVTDPTDENAVNQIINRDTLIIGTKLKSRKGKPYPIYQQKGAPEVHLPARPFLFIGPESGFGTDATRGRLERWTGILRGYVQAVLRANLKGGE